MRKSQVTVTPEISVCLDEISAAQDLLSGKLAPEQVTTLNSWIRRQKLRLKELNYGGKISRKPRKRKGKKDDN